MLDSFDFCKVWMIFLELCDDIGIDVRVFAEQVGRTVQDRGLGALPVAEEGEELPFVLDVAEEGVVDQTGVRRVSFRFLRFQIRG